MKNTNPKTGNVKKDVPFYSSISGKLVVILIPLIAIIMIVLMAFVLAQAKTVISNTAKDSLDNESHYQAEKLALQLEKIVTHYDGVVESIEEIQDVDNKDILRILKPTRSYSNLCSSGVYIGLTTKEFIYYNEQNKSDYSLENDPCLKDGYVPAERSWYTGGINNDHFQFIGSPYTDNSTGATVISMARKIKLKDGRSGVAAADIVLDPLVETTSKIKPMDSGSMMLFSGDDILSYVDPKQNGKKLSDLKDDSFAVDLQTVSKKATEKILYGAENPTTRVTADDGSVYYASPAKVGKTGWTVVCCVYEKVVLADLYKFQNIAYIFLAIALVVFAILMLTLITVIVSKPIKAITEVISRITDNDFTVDIVAKSKDEIGVMSRYLKFFLEQMNQSLTNIRNVSNDLSSQADGSRLASESLSTEATEQSSAMEQIKLAMDGMTDAVTELANNATDLAGEVNELMDKGDTANETMNTLVTKAQNGQHDMANVKKGMEGISASMNEMNEVVSTVGESTQKINSIIEMINSIAEQTNLLSLNASIEAARAGEAGKGFAVVASEIGTLASDSADSTTQIAAIIQDITKQIDQLSNKAKTNVEEIASSTEAVNIAGDTFAQIFDDVQETNTTIKDMMDMMSNVDNIASSVAAISEEQSASSQEVSSTVEKLAISAQQVAAESEEVAASANTVTESSTKINDALSIFKTV
ncbi:methyl-accepting chemotaxis protein [Lachnobacterium bovis]|uniref:methyl-accepting chemotaxis protein n=1 Tax=Lachnobacterium bovis TaxID=140626 RepID=UPI00049047D2|nr:methyl-accepting chemotaxis protein [Lachnobacterium bovis]